VHVRDDELMAQAVLAARAARRRTAPWPAVGCVIAREGDLVATGATGPFPTGPHAEVAALRAAGDRARGATAFTTLEPCNHHGNTPPCTDALIEAGVSRVVVAVDDPDPRVAGRGYARLTEAGVEVVRVPNGAATRDLAPYLHHRRTGRPYVVAKVALSLDGRIAAADGTSQWITSDAARRDAQELRADAQAILVGAGTALADDPALTVRDVEPAPARPPLRVLLDAQGRVPARGALADTTVAPTLVVTTASARAETLDGWRAAGAKVETVAAAPDRSGVDLDATFALLATEGVLQALVEGGAQVLGSVISGGHAQRLVAYVAPTILGTSGLPGFATAGPVTLADAARWNIVGVSSVGADVRIEMEAA
jgi:diaminohydroxyphosphoribosylaminopyrimidine deaminase/5-amino-6-(5-phosphoribosylamino)uracil reductase